MTVYKPTGLALQCSVSRRPRPTTRPAILADKTKTIVASIPLERFRLPKLNPRPTLRKGSHTISIKNRIQPGIITPPIYTLAKVMSHTKTDPTITTLPLPHSKLPHRTSPSYTRPRKYSKQNYYLTHSFRSLVLRSLPLEYGRLYA